MDTKSQANLLELLLKLMPELRQRLPSTGVHTNNKAATALYEVWSSEENKVSDHKFRRPMQVSSQDVSLMESEGLITASGEQLTITKKGGEVLRQMILGDSRSVFDTDKQRPDYFTAVANTQLNKQKRTKTASVVRRPVGTNWYWELKNARP